MGKGKKKKRKAEKAAKAAKKVTKLRVVKKKAAKKTTRKAAKKVSAIPAGFHTVTPYLTVADGVAALALYKRAFGAKELMRLGTPEGRLMHAEIKIGDSIIFVSDEFPGADTQSPAALGGTSTTIHLNVRAIDKAFAQAIEAGCTAVMAPADMFWGDRFGKLKDPFGHSWSLAQHIEDVPPKEIAKRAAAMFPPPPAA